MIYLITDRHIKQYKTLEEIEEKEKIKIDEVELQTIGADEIIKLTNKDLDFVRDKYLLSRIPLERLYGNNTIEQKQKNKKNITTVAFSIILLVSLFVNTVTIGLLCIK